jgi:ERCC4-type nuclease
VEPGFEFLVDSREKDKFIQLVNLAKIPYRVTALNADLVLRRNTRPASEVVGIERKAINDLVQSIQSKRIFDQIKRLKATHEIPFLMISGSLEELEWKFKQELNMTIQPSVVYGSIASIIVRERVNVMWFPNDRTLIDVAYRICTKISEGKWGEERMLAAKYEVYNPIKMLVMHIPGMTTVKAKRLLEKFGTMKGIALADQKQLESVEGVGPELAKLVVGIFERKE